MHWSVEEGKGEVESGEGGGVWASGYAAGRRPGRRA